MAAPLPPLPPAFAGADALRGKVADFAPVAPAQAAELCAAWLDLDRFVDVACGISVPGEAANLPQRFASRPWIRLWRAQVRDAPGHEEAWAVFSEVTANACIALFQPRPRPRRQAQLGILEGLGPQGSAALYADLLETFAATYFAQAGTRTLYSHAALPLDARIQATYVEHGWDAIRNLLGGPVAPRFIYGLERQIYELYHAPVRVADEEDF